MTSFCANENSKLCNDCGHWAECPECGVCGLCRLYDPPSEQRTYCLKHYRQTFPGKGCDMCEMEARIEALEDFNYRRRKAYRDRVIDALHNIDTEESPELEDALNLAHNAIYNAVTKALLEGE